MGVFILLDGGITPLKVEAVAGQGRPIGLIPLVPVPADVKESFLNAGFAMYNALQRKGLPVKNTVLAYRLDRDVAGRIYGGSGSLPFAIAVMYGMLDELIQVDIGATGAINDIATGKVDRVEAINEKLKAGIEGIGKGTILFYPSANEEELSDELRTSARAKGIKLQPVHDIPEVIECLFPPIIEKKCPTRLIVLVAMLVLIYILYGSFSHSLAVYLIESGRYSLTGWHLRISSRVAFWDRELDRVFRDFKTPLNTEVLFLVMFSSESGQEKTYLIDRVPEGISLSKEDFFAFRVYSSGPVYVYIYQFDAGGSPRRLYPADNPVVPLRKAETLPERGVWLKPQGLDGNIEIYVVLSRWRCRDLDKLSSPAELRQHIALRDIKGGPTEVKQVCFIKEGKKR